MERIFPLSWRMCRFAPHCVNKQRYISSKSVVIISLTVNTYMPINTSYQKDLFVYDKHARHYCKCPVQQGFTFGYAKAAMFFGYGLTIFYGGILVSSDCISYQVWQFNPLVLLKFFFEFVGKIWWAFSLVSWKNATIICFYVFIIHLSKVRNQKPDGF